MKIFVILTFICWLCNSDDIIRFSDCVSDFLSKGWRERCHSECHDLEEGSEICSHLDHIQGCQTCSGTSSFCRSMAKCVCTCYVPDTYCELADIYNYVWDTDSCAITQLERVDEEIETQIVTYVAELLVGKIPAIGALFDFAFAVYEPVGHITSALAFVNQLRDDVNISISELQGCMDEDISNVKAEFVIDQQQSLITQYYEAGLASGVTQIEAIESLFNNWNENLYFFQTYSTSTTMGRFLASFYMASDLLGYLGMLPVYQALYPLYGVLAIERVNCLVSALDYDNIENISVTANARFRMFEDWILDARAYIYGEVTHKLRDNCNNSALMENTISDWFETFDERYIDTLQNYWQTFNTFINYITATTTTTTTTTTAVAAKTLGEKCTPGQCVDGLFCSPKYEYTKTTRNSWRIYSTKICCDSSNYLNEHESCSCVAECQGIHNQNAMSCCNGKCRNYEKFEDEFGLPQWLCPS